MTLLEEFEEFAVKGNAIDLAVGVIIGAGFNDIVDSLVNDIIMPPLGLLTGGMDFADQALTLQQATADTPAVTLNYGQFINALIDFVLIAFVVFLLVRYMNKLRAKDAADETTEAASAH